MYFCKCWVWLGWGGKRLVRPACRGAAWLLRMGPTQDTLAAHLHCMSYVNCVSYVILLHILLPPSFQGRYNWKRGHSQGRSHSLCLSHVVVWLEAAGAASASRPAPAPALAPAPAVAHQAAPVPGRVGLRGGAPSIPKERSESGQGAGLCPPLNYTLPEMELLYGLPVLILNQPLSDKVLPDIQPKSHLLQPKPVISCHVPSGHLITLPITIILLAFKDCYQIAPQSSLLQMKLS